MLYKNNKETCLKEELFINPTSEYRGTPFWSWNCKVTKELIKSQLEIFKQMGFGGAHLHPRTGLQNEYLGNEFMELVKYTNKLAKEKEMLCWLYDEDRYPSGAAGGIVTENWDYRARYLLLTREKKEGMCDSKNEFREKVSQGEKPLGYYVTAYRVKIEDGCLTSYKEIPGNQPHYNSLAKEKEEGKLWFAYMELMKESPWYNDQTYVDVMNKEAIKRFLEVTHERYYEELGKDFGGSIPAIFTDEPQIRGSMVFSDGECEEDVTLSFTDDFSDTYEEAYGVSLLSVLPELMWELPDKEMSIHRYQYHDHLTERFVSAYSDTIADWCEEHNIALTGHYMSESTLYSQTLRLGEAMRCYRKQQLPGVDILCGDPEYSTIKQAVSVARQNKREGVLSELYGVTHWYFDFKGHKLQGDWQAALGVTIRCHHLAFMSMEGEAKRDWPASINYQSPWWEKYSYIENYFSRVNTALTRGKAIVKTAIIHPIESYWMLYGPVSQTQTQRQQLDDNFKNLIEWMLFGCMDFDFISESMLPEQSAEGVNGEGELTVGDMAYGTIIVPGLKTIRSTTLKKLEELIEKGGKVIFLGEVPELVDGRRSDCAKGLAEKAFVIPYQKYNLLNELQEERIVEIRKTNGDLSDNLFYQMRQDNDEKWLFVCHVNRKENRNDTAQKMIVRVRGEYEIICYDALQGDIYNLNSKTEDGWTVVTMELYGEDSFLWKLVPAKSSEASAVREEEMGDYPVPVGAVEAGYGLVAGNPFHGGKRERVFTTIYEPDGFTLEEPNVLLLDYAKWKLDEGNLNEKEEILRIDNKIRALLGYPRRQDAFTQPWRIKENKEDNLVTLYYTITSQIEAKEVILAMERPEKAKIWWNDVLCDGAVKGQQEYYVDSFIKKVPLPVLRAGENQLRLEIPFGRKTNLENIFLLGDFGVDVRGTRQIITKREEKITFGDVTRQGLAFYGGNILYTMKFTLEEETAVKVRVPHFSSPVLEVMVDGINKGLIAFSPHTLSLGVLDKGEHRLEICVYGNRFNSFGTLHNCNKEFKWYGPDSYRTSQGEWSESWGLREFGILSRVEILKDESKCKLE